MTSLLRTRAAVSEMARTFAAEAEPNLDWRESIWPGDRVPVVVEADGMRRLTTMAWGLPAEAFSSPVPAKQRGTLYSRDFWRTSTRLDDPTALSRCLIILEAFAYPSGVAGRCMRSWIGLWDEPLVAWAGVCTQDGCAGVIIGANPCVEPLSRTMPRLLMPDDHARWLEGGTLLSLGPAYPEEAFYRECLAERWSTGQPDDQVLPLFATG